MRIEEEKNSLSKSKDSSKAEEEKNLFTKHKSLNENNDTPKKTEEGKEFLRKSNTKKENIITESKVTTESNTEREYEALDGIENKVRINPVDKNEDVKTKKKTHNNSFPIKIVTEGVPKLDLSSINELGNFDAKESENSEDPSPIATHAEEKKFEGDEMKIPDPMLGINSEIPKKNEEKGRAHVWTPSTIKNIVRRPLL